MKLTEKQLNQMKSFLKVKNGRTVNETAEKLGISKVTTRKYISEFLDEGSIQVVGQTNSGTQGRPAALYAAANAPAETPAATEASAI